MIFSLDKFADEADKFCREQCKDSVKREQFTSSWLNTIQDNFKKNKLMSKDEINQTYVMTLVNLFGSFLD